MEQTIVDIVPDNIPLFFKILVHKKQAPLTINFKYDKNGDSLFNFSKSDL